AAFLGSEVSLACSSLSWGPSVAGSIGSDVIGRRLRRHVKQDVVFDVFGPVPKIGERSPGIGGDKKAAEAGGRNRDSKRHQLTPDGGLPWRLTVPVIIPGPCNCERGNDPHALWTHHRRSDPVGARRRPGLRCCRALRAARHLLTSAIFGADCELVSD